jgi:hypothetical protein
VIEYSSNVTYKRELVPASSAVPLVHFVQWRGAPDLDNVEAGVENAAVVAHKAPEQLGQGLLVALFPLKHANVNTCGKGFAW